MLTPTLAVAALAAALTTAYRPADPAGDFVQHLAAEGVDVNDVACTNPAEAGQTFGWGVVCYGSEIVDGTFTTLWAGLDTAATATRSRSPACRTVPPRRLGRRINREHYRGDRNVRSRHRTCRYRRRAGDVPSRRAHRGLRVAHLQLPQGLSGETDDIITIDLATDPGAQVVVEIQPSDVAFDSSGCGDWERVEN